MYIVAYFVINLIYRAGLSDEQKVDDDIDNDDFLRFFPSSNDYEANIAIFQTIFYVFP